MMEQLYLAVKPRVTFTSSSVWSLKWNNFISNKTKIVWFTHWNAVAQTVIYVKLPGICELLSVLISVIKDHVPKYVKEHIKNQPKTTSIATLNAMNGSSVAESSIKNPVNGKNYNE